MAYNKEKIYKQAEEAIKSHNLFFIEDIVAFLPCNKDTFYRFFPTDSDEYDTLKDLLDDNKVKTKSSIRAKLWKSNKASELLALYKLIATNEERRALQMQYTENKHEVTQKADLSKLSDAELRKLAEMQSKSGASS
jgi:hypothetical protein